MQVQVSPGAPIVNPFEPRTFDLKDLKEIIGLKTGGFLALEYRNEIYPFCRLKAVKFHFLALPIFIGFYDAHSMDCSDLARLLIKWNQPSRVRVLIQEGGLTEPHSLTLSRQRKGRAAVLEVIEKTAPLMGDMTLPKELLIHLHPAGASWDFKIGILNHHFGLLSSQMGDQVRQEFAHEWAHVVFDMNLRTKSPVWNNIAKIRLFLNQLFP